MPKKKVNIVGKIPSDCCSGKNGCGGVAYGLGLIGAAVYYIQVATSFWGGVLGLLKAIVWPAFLVYELLRFLGA